MTVILNRINQFIQFLNYNFNNSYNIYYSYENNNKTDNTNKNNNIFNSSWLKQYKFEFEQFKKNGIKYDTYFLDK